MPIKGDRYICDMLREFEKQRKALTSDISQHYIFKKRLDYSTTEVSTDLVELDLLYAEVLKIKGIILM
jgi:hypothetical protein